MEEQQKIQMELKEIRDLRKQMEFKAKPLPIMYKKS